MAHDYKYHVQEEMSGVGEDWDNQHVALARGGLGHCDNTSFIIEWY